MVYEIIAEDVQNENMLVVIHKLFSLTIIRNFQARINARVQQK